MAIGVEYLGFRNKSKVFFLFVYDGQVPGSCILKHLHDFAHWHGVGDDGLRGVHELLHRETIIETRLEHDVAYFVKE